MPDQAYHITQRGTNRQRVFFTDADRNPGTVYSIADLLRRSRLLSRLPQSRPSAQNDLDPRATDGQMVPGIGV